MPNLPIGNRLLALLAIWALLLCHGAFGALHLTSPGEHTMIHPPSHGVAPDEHPAPHHAEYFAVLLGTLLGSLALWLLLRNDRWQDTVFSARRLAGSPRATISNLPRGPTIPLLQVLRL